MCDSARIGEADPTREVALHGPYLLLMACRISDTACPKMAQAKSTAWPVDNIFIYEFNDLVSGRKFVTPYQ